MAGIAQRRSDTGLIRPYRPKPADFREVYIAMGWDGIDEHYRTNWRCIRRWIKEEGPGLKVARAEYVASLKAPTIRRGTPDEAARPSIATGREQQLRAILNARQTLPARRLLINE